MYTQTKGTFPVAIQFDSQIKIFIFQQQQKKTQNICHSNHQKRQVRSSGCFGVNHKPQIHMRVYIVQYKNKESLDSTELYPEGAVCAPDKSHIVYAHFYGIFWCFQFLTSSSDESRVFL